MLDAENAAFVNQVVTAARYAFYLVATVGSLYLAYVILRFIWEAIIAPPWRRLSGLFRSPKGPLDF